PHDAAFTAGSFAINAIGRPPTLPIPVTTPSAPSPSCSQFASRPSSASESWSSSRATRARTGSFCCSATFFRCRSGPPSSAASRAALTSLISSPLVLRTRLGRDVALGGDRVLLGVRGLLGARRLHHLLIFLGVLE